MNKINNLLIQTVILSEAKNIKAPSVMRSKRIKTGVNDFLLHNP